ncbi:MAG: amino acid aminotransferase [Planctomycetota bacterium]
MSHLFSTVTSAPPDAILGLNEAFNADANPDKVNLTVGVYKDEHGVTPILDSVKRAEKRLLEDETTKGYLAIDGLPDYQDRVREMVFGDVVSSDRVAVVQSPGGTGGLRIAGGFLQANLPATRLWMPNPTWANHSAVFAGAGVATETYRYLGADRTAFDLDGMLEDLGNANVGDAVLLHGCCHNPTGIDPAPEDWKAIADAVRDRGLLPLVDFAYQGFGDGLEQDALGLRTVLGEVDEAIVCSSFSKNFGLYSERVGALALVAADQSQRDASRSQLKKIVRTIYSNPPRHGGSIVATILGDDSLTAQWKVELEAMRTRITSLRESFVAGMKQAGKDFSFLLNQRGMFSFSGLTPMQVDELRSKHSIYIVGSGRINVAGLTEAKMQLVCDAVASVMS